MDALEKIYTKFRNNNFIKTIKELEKYFGLKESKIGVYDELINIYIECLIKLGELDEAIKYIDLLHEYFPKFFMNEPYELAKRYAICAKGERVEEILKNNTFTDEQYFYIASSCYRNGNVELAKKIFQEIVARKTTEENKKFQNFARKALEKIELYEEHKDNAFLKQSYAYFKYTGNKLQPGHIIYASRITEEFKENRNYNNPQKMGCPYMIWKIEKGLLYTFPVTSNTNPNRYIFKSEDYGYQHPDRCLKDRLVVIKKSDIANVEEKINEDDLERALHWLYRSVYISHKGTYQDDISYFMQEMANEKSVGVGEVLIVPDFEKKQNIFYFVLGSDNVNKKLKCIEIDKSFKPVGEYLKLAFIDMSVPIFDKIVLGNIELKERLLNLRPNAFAKDNMIGLAFDYGNRKLEILEETEESYICMNVTNGYIPETVEVVFIPKNISIFNVELIPEELLKEQQRLFEEYKQNNMEEFISKSEEFKRVLKKKEN